MLTTRELATLLKAGMPIDRALSVLAEIARDGAMRAFLEDVLKSVRSGSTLADALEPHKGSLPAYYIGLVRAGEAGGALESVLSRLAESLERAQLLRETIRSAMYYPAFVLVMSVLTLVVLFTLVIPEFRPLFEDSATGMPTSMAVVIAFSDALRDYWWAILLVVLAIILAVQRHNRTPEGRRTRDRLILRLPLLGDLVTSPVRWIHLADEVRAAARAQRGADLGLAHDDDVATLAARAGRADGGHEARRAHRSESRERSGGGCGDRWALHRGSRRSGGVLPS